MLKSSPCKIAVALAPLASLPFSVRAEAAAGPDSLPPAVWQENLLLFLGTNLGKSLLVVLFFLIIVLALRFFFGPGGRLRDPKWDRLNEEQKQADAERKRSLAARKRFQARLPELEPLLAHETEVFKTYAAEFLNGNPEHDAMHLLKREHSLNVLGHAFTIAAHEEDFLPPRSDARIPQPDRILLFSALYHDLGRFEQLKRYNTFRDDHSANHGKLGALLLRSILLNGKPRFMAGEPPEVRGQVRTAVLLHNRFALPRLLNGGLRPVCNALRDADKLDIIRVLAVELAPGHTPDPTVILELADEPEKHTQAVLQSVLKNEQVAYKDLRYVNDFRLLLCSWLNGLTYNASRRILAKSGSLEQIMRGLPPGRDFALLRETISARLEKYLL